jgi:hypothetical protein
VPGIVWCTRTAKISKTVHIVKELIDRGGYKQEQIISGKINNSNYTGLLCCRVTWELRRPEEACLGCNCWAGICTSLTRLEGTFWAWESGIEKSIWLAWESTMVDIMPCTKTLGRGKGVAQLSADQAHFDWLELALWGAGVKKDYWYITHPLKKRSCVPEGCFVVGRNAYSLLSDSWAPGVRSSYPVLQEGTGSGRAITQRLGG